MTKKDIVVTAHAVKSAGDCVIVSEQPMTVGGTVGNTLAVLTDVRQAIHDLEHFTRGWDSSG